MITPYFQDSHVTIYYGDNADVLPSLSNLDCCVTDPPYGLSFMGKEWDYDVPSKETWAHILNSLKPGAHLLSFFGSRTYHRGVCNIEDAGFEIRDMVEWVYGSGFPKSLDISKALDKMGGTYIKGIVSPNSRNKRHSPSGCFGDTLKDMTVDEPQSPSAILWQGWGTALKPAHEPIVLARKPLIGTVASNVLAYGTGGINIDGCRVEAGIDYAETERINDHAFGGSSVFPSGKLKPGFKPSLGRFPANLIHDGSEEVLACFPNVKTGEIKPNQCKFGGIFGNGKLVPASHQSSDGSASRFFYCAKASKSERDAGCEELPDIEATEMTGRQEGSAGLLRVRADGSIGENPYAGKSGKAHNNHPTVKPLALMEYLIKLVTPPNGVILDPFAGSGSTGVAAKKLGFKCVLIERDEKSCEIAAKRCSQELQFEAML